MSRVDLSIVVTAHNEGILLHKTLRSVFDATKGLEKEKIKYEIIIHVDNGDKSTLNYLGEYKKNRKIRVVENSFGDLGQSRNYAVTIANGKYVSFLDGDDLISSNWYVAALRVLEDSEEECVAYPEAVLTFQDDRSHILTLQKESFNTKEDVLTLLGANQWGSVVTAKKTVFEKVPYMFMEDGYCFEDYAFNIQTLELGISHIIVPKTTLFYRRSSESMLARANNDNYILPRMKMFELGAVDKQFAEELFFEDNGEEEVESGTLEEKEKTFRDNIIYRKLRENWFLNYLITPLLRLALEAKKKIGHNVEEEIETIEEGVDESYKDNVPNVPEFVVKTWREINKIEIQLYPTAEDLKETMLYDARDSINIGRSYANLSHAFSYTPDYVFIVPWLVMGGADKVLLNYIDALLKIHPDWHIAVIATLIADNEWADKLPEAVDFYDLGEMNRYLTPGGMDILFSLLITQLGCERLHIINSELGYRWVNNHKKLIEQSYSVNVSFFAEERVLDKDNNERIVSFENPCLFNIFGDVENVFTDNENIVDIVVGRNAFDRDKFKVHYQPVDLSIRKRKNAQKKTKRILWAGRIDIVKMPELVLKIGEQLEGDIQIDMYGAITNDCYNEQMFENAKNINYCGKYNGFQEIPVDNYDLFLYTSKNDGMPNAILEATAAGLPIIASNDGGVGEFIRNKKTGLLVQDFRNAKEYVEVISDVYKGKYDLDEYVQNAQKLLKERHSKSRFMDLVKKDIG